MAITTFIGKKLAKGLTENVGATYALTRAMNSAFSSQQTLSRLSISTGNQSMMAINNLSDTFNNVGMSMSESLDMFTSMSRQGLKMTDQSTKDTLSSLTRLGKDVKAHAASIAFNNQTLGISNSHSLKLQSTLIETAAAYHIDSDILVQALNSLSNVLIQSAAVYGKETALALEQATPKLIAAFGPANKKLVEEAANAIFGGTEKSTRLAAMLGLDISNLATGDEATMISTFKEALLALNARIGGASGRGASGFIVPKLLERFGATPGMLQLAKLGPVSERQLSLNLETLAAQQLQVDLIASLESIMKNLSVALLPLVAVVASFTSKVSELFSTVNGYFIRFISSMVAIKLVLKARDLIAQTETLKTHAHLSRIETATWAVRNAVLGSSGAKAASSMAAGAVAGGARGLLGALGGPIGIGITLAATFLPMLLSSSEEEIEISKDILSEQEKQTAALLNADKQTEWLSRIAGAVARANLYNEELILNQREQIDISNDIKDKPTPTFQGNDGSFDLK